MMPTTTTICQRWVDDDTENKPPCRSNACKTGVEVQDFVLSSGIIRARLKNAILVPRNAMIWHTK